MSSEIDRPDDTLLSAWLDGELDGPDGQAVRTWLDAHPEDAARVQAWDGDRCALREAFDPVAAEAVPPALTALVQGAELATDGRGPRAWHQQPWVQAAMAAGLLLAGGVVGAALALRGGGAAVLADATPPWAQRAAAAHAVYVPEVRHPVEVSVREGSAEQQRAQEEHLARWLTKRLALPVKLVDLSAQGYQLVGGRLLPDASQPSAQFMYEDAQGQRVTLYLRKPENNTEVAFRHQQQGANGLLYWVDGGHGWALVGPMPRERLLALGELVYRQTEAQVQATQASPVAPAAPAAASR